MVMFSLERTDMKTILTALFVMACSFVQAQSELFEKKVSFNNQRVDIDAELVDKITISNWAEKQVGVVVKYSINDGDLNDLLQVSLDEGSNRIRLKVELDDKKLEDGGYYSCDDEKAMSWGRNGKQNRICLDVVVEVKLPADAELDVESVIGDLFIAGTYKELYAKTVTGDIELEWPESQGAEVEIKTVNGGIYTNHNFQMKQDRGLPLISSHEVKGNLGKGGKYVSLETVTSDIYFKKN